MKTFIVQLTVALILVGVTLLGYLPAVADVIHGQISSPNEPRVDEAQKKLANLPTNDLIALIANTKDYSERQAAKNVLTFRAPGILPDLRQAATNQETEVRKFVRSILAYYEIVPNATRPEAAKTMGTVIVGSAPMRAVEMMADFLFTRLSPELANELIEFRTEWERDYDKNRLPRTKAENAALQERLIAFFKKLMKEKKLQMGQIEKLEDGDIKVSFNGFGERYTLRSDGVHQELFITKSESAIFPPTLTWTPRPGMPAITWTPGLQFSTSEHFYHRIGEIHWPGKEKLKLKPTTKLSDAIAQYVESNIRVAPKTDDKPDEEILVAPIPMLRNGQQVFVVKPSNQFLSDREASAIDVKLVPFSKELRVPTF
jgi:hypothetical protein